MSSVMQFSPGYTKGHISNPHMSFAHRDNPTLVKRDSPNGYTVHPDALWEVEFKSNAFPHRQPTEVYLRLLDI